MSKLKTAFWFIKKPQYIPQIFQVLKRKKNQSLEYTHIESMNWCKANCIDHKEALKQLIKIDQTKELIDLFPNEIKEAQCIADLAPVKMGGGGAASFIYYLVKYSNAQNIIETGVAYGWSSLAILLAIKDSKDAKLISNDMPYVNMGNDDYVGCVISNKLKYKWELQRLPDVRGIPLALKKFKNIIDLCHYDSDKSYTAECGQLLYYGVL